MPAVLSAIDWMLGLVSLALADIGSLLAGWNIDPMGPLAVVALVALILWFVL